MVQRGGEIAHAGAHRSLSFERARLDDDTARGVGQFHQRLHIFRGAAVVAAQGMVLHAQCQHLRTLLGAQV